MVFHHTPKVVKKIGIYQDLRWITQPTGRLPEIQLMKLNQLANRHLELQTSNNLASQFFLPWDSPVIKNEIHHDAVIANAGIPKTISSTQVY